MNDKLTVFCGFIGVIGSIIARALGGWDDAVAALLIFMAIDFITGLICAAVFGKSKKSDRGSLSSKACWRGLVKKVCTLLIVVVGHYVDVLIGADYIRNAVTIAFCVSEIISICENADMMGILPEGVQKVFDKALDVLKNKDNENDKKK